MTKSCQTTNRNPIAAAGGGLLRDFRNVEIYLSVLYDIRLVHRKI